MYVTCSVRDEGTNPRKAVLLDVFRAILLDPALLRNGGLFSLNYLKTAPDPWAVGRRTSRDVVKRCLGERSDYVGAKRP